VVRTGRRPGDAHTREGILIASQLSGLATTRYVLGLEPMADASVDVVVAAVGPTLQRYLTGQLPLPDSSMARGEGLGPQT
jgi:hypothetical protein